MQSLLSNPIGNGFSKIYTEKYGISSPHNVLTYVIWAAGVAAFIWVPMFGMQIKKYFSLKDFRNKNKENDKYLILSTAFQVGLLSWLLNNMAHNSINTGLAWFCFGVVLNIRRKLSSEDGIASDEIINDNKITNTRYPQLRK